MRYITLAAPLNTHTNGLQRHIHLHTHVSMSSTYVSVFQLLPVNPPNTTALWWSILVKVWLSSGGGLSPVILGTAHTPAGTVTEQKCVSLSGQLTHVEDSISASPHNIMAVVMCGCGHIMHLIHTVVYVNDWNANYNNYISTGEGVNKPQFM